MNNGLQDVCIVYRYTSVYFVVGNFTFNPRGTRVHVCTRVHVYLGNTIKQFLIVL